VKSGAGCGERWQAYVPDGVLAVAPRATLPIMFRG